MTYWSASEQLYRERPIAVFAAGALVAGAVAIAAALVSPLAGLLPVAVIGALLLARSASLRTGFLVFGGLVTLHSGQDELTALKLVYLIGATVALVAALWRVVSLRRSEAFRAFTPVLYVSVFFFLLICFSLPVALGDGTPFAMWLRDATSYGLFASIPVFALDFGLAAPHALASAMFVVAGTASAIAFDLEWIERHHFADVPFDSLLLPSVFLPAALFSYAAAATTQERRKAAWFGVAAVVLALLAASGTRSVVILVLAPLTIVLLAWGSRAQIAVRLGFTLAAFALLVFVPAILSSQLVESRTPDAQSASDTASDRFTSIPDVLEDPGSDESYSLRSSQWRIAWETFKANLVVGVGPGHLFEWPYPYTKPGIRTGYNLDTPIAFPAKFGLVGLGVLGASIGAFIVFLRRLVARRPLATHQLALAGFAAVVVAAVPLGTTFEEKGFSFGLLFLLAAVVRAASSSNSNGPGSDQANGPAGLSSPSRRSTGVCQ